MERRDLFTYFFKPKQKEVKEIIIRPPYFGDEFSFDKDCQNCEGICANFCQEKIIVIQDDKTPKIDFSFGGCTYCDECAKVCPLGVLSIENKSIIKATVKIENDKCMSWNNVMCFSCKDPCLEDAIKFNGIFRPTIDEEKCTSCGFCIGVCPSLAITVSEVKNNSKK